MSHAAYSFLIDMNDDHLEPHEVENEWASRMENYLDENNWWEAIALVYPDGHVHNFGAYDYFDGTEGKWQNALDFAATCVGAELVLNWGDDSGVKTVEGLASYLPEAKEMVAGLYRRDPETTHEVWKRSRLSTILNELLYSSMAGVPLPWSFGPKSPYDHIRAQSLVHADGRPQYILVVDIHT
jgi:hypothetical protein